MKGCVVLIAWPAMISIVFAQSGFDLQGHRGARGLAPENTIPAFQKALELGVTTLEMDVVITADGKVVVSHEPWMSDVICRNPDSSDVKPGSMMSTNIYKMSYEEVLRYDCGSRPHPRFPEQALLAVAKPLLADVIDFAESFTREKGLPPVQYNIETKCLPAGDRMFHPRPEAFVVLVHGIIQEKGIAERTTLQSFDVRTLQAMKQLDSTITLALLVENHKGWQANLEALGFTPDIYSPDYQLLSRKIIRQLQNQGMRVIPWTVNDPKAMQKLIRWNADGLITDYPDRGVKVLEKGRKEQPK